MTLKLLSSLEFYGLFEVDATELLLLSKPDDTMVVSLDTSDRGLLEALLCLQPLGW